jgi:hypothetical protein
VPGAGEALPELDPDEVSEAGSVDGDAEQEEPEEHGELVRVAQPSQVRRQLGRPREELVARREAFLDALRLVAGGPEQPRQLDRRPEILR